MKFLRRRRTFGNNPYYSRVKRRRMISPLWLVMSIPVVLLLLELLTRLFVGVSGKQADFDAYSGKSAIATTYHLRYLTENQEDIAGLPQPGQLRALRNLTTGYHLLGNQEQAAWKINAQGFRDDETLPLAKPKQEMRLFILGGSTAFGQGNQGNAATIAHKLEVRLNAQVNQQQQSPQHYRPDIFPFFKPDRAKAFKLKPKLLPKQYRVINAAVPGYTSGNQLAQLALHILPYQPDVIIVLDGYGDLLLSSDRPMMDIPYISHYLADAAAHFRHYAGQSLQQGLQKSYLVKALTYFTDAPEATISQKTLMALPDPQALDSYLPQEDVELERRVARYQEHHQQMIQLSAGSNASIILAFQPEITGRSLSNLSQAEQMIREQLGQAYTDRIPKDYPKFAQVNQRLAQTFPSHVKALNLYAVTEQLPAQAFTDPIHLSEAANDAIAELLFQAIVTWPKFHLIPTNFVLKDH